MPENNSQDNSIESENLAEMGEEIEPSLETDAVEPSSDDAALHGDENDSPSSLADASSDGRAQDNEQGSAPRKRAHRRSMKLSFDEDRTEESAVNETSVEQASEDDDRGGEEEPAPSDQAGRSERLERPEHPEGSEQAKDLELPDDPDQSEQSDDLGQSARSDQPEQAEKPEKTEHPERPMKHASIDDIEHTTESAAFVDDLSKELDSLFESDPSDADIADVAEVAATDEEADEKDAVEAAAVDEQEVAEFGDEAEAAEAVVKAEDGEAVGQDNEIAEEVAEDDVEDDAIGFAAAEEAVAEDSVTEEAVAEIAAADEVEETAKVEEATHDDDVETEFAVDPDGDGSEEMRIDRDRLAEEIEAVSEPEPQFTQVSPQLTQTDPQPTKPTERKPTKRQDAKRRKAERKAAKAEEAQRRTASSAQAPEKQQPTKREKRRPEPAPAPTPEKRPTKRDPQAARPEKPEQPTKREKREKREKPERKPQRFLQSTSLKQAFRNFAKLDPGAAWRETCWSLIAFMVLFALVALAVVDQLPAIDSFNTIINAIVHSTRGTLDPFVVALTTIGDFIPMAGICLLICAFLYLRKKWDSLAFFITNVVLAVICVQALKLIFAVPRPGDETLVPLPISYSFPSAHSFCSLVVFGMIGLLIYRALVARGVQRDNAMIPAIILIAFAIMVGISRIYVGVHWPSDVLGGWLLGAAWLSFAGALYTAGARQK